MEKKVLMIIFINSDSLDTTCIANVHRLPFFYTLASQLNEASKILVVTHYISLISSVFQQPKRIISQFKKPQLKQILPNMFTWVPWVPWNVSLAERSPFLLHVFRQCLKRSLQSAIKMLDFNNQSIKIVWLTHPYHLHYCGLIDEGFAVYDCYDDFAMLGPKARIDRVRNLERQLVQKSDLVLSTARSLYDRHKQYNANTHYFPNAVEFGLFHQAADPSTTVDERLIQISKPIIGFMGNLSDWFDFSLLHELIIIRPQWSFVFVGGVANNVHEDVTKMKQRQNAFFLGWQKYETLPGILKGFDVAIMPYKMNALMQSVNPNKMYQLMAAGVPIVSTPIPEVLRYSDVISVAGDAQGFVHQIELCLSQRNSSRQDRMISLAAKETWDERVKMVLNLINEGLEARKIF